MRNFELVRKDDKTIDNGIYHIYASNDLHGIFLEIHFFQFNNGDIYDVEIYSEYCEYCLIDVYCEEKNYPTKFGLTIIKTCIKNIDEYIEVLQELKTAIEDIKHFFATSEHAELWSKNHNNELPIEVGDTYDGI